MEKCIIRNNPPLWYNERHPGLERNEIFHGVKNRDKSIEDGLVVFMTPTVHRTGKNSFHLNPENKLWKDLKKEAQITWMKYYNKTEDEFRERYGRSYLI